jgi:hypothetical protein
VSQLFNRLVRVTVIPTVIGKYQTGDTVDAIVIENLRVQFKVAKDNKPEPNTAEILISNLSEQTRARLSDKGTRVILEAGYPGTLAQLFSGDATFVDQLRDGADWVTKIECGDGERAYNRARVNESFAPDTEASHVVTTVAKRIGLDIGNLQDQSEQIKGQFSNGYSARGTAATVLNKLLKAQGLEWSIQDGTLQVLQPGKPNKDLAIELSPESGLIGSPSHGTPGERGDPPTIKIKSLLEPSFRPGGTVNLQSASQKGSFRIEKVEHTGDTEGADWYSELECTTL